MRLPFLLACLALPPAAPHAAAAPDRAGEEFFESNVRPLLVQLCQECHGPKRQRGGLRLDSRAALLKGGDTGPAVVPGKADDSLLLRAVRHQGDVKMPPKKKLTDQQVQTLFQ